MNIELSNSLRAMTGFASRYAKQLAIIIACGLLGIVFAVVSGQSSTDALNRTDTWTLPQDLPFNLSSSVGDMLVNPIFGGEPIVLAEEEVEEEVQEGEQEVGSWKLVGIISEGPNRTILFKDETSGRLVEARAGEYLPGGEQIISIEENSIELILRDEQFRISLFQDLGNRED